MPDTFTHFSIAYLVGQHKSFKRHLTIFLIGTVLPDVLGNAPWYFIKEFIKEAYWILAPFHSPLVLFVICFMISLFFEKELRKEVFTYLILGTGLHLLLDHSQLQFGFHYFYYPLFPFSFWGFQIPLFRHIDDSMYLVPFLIILTFIFYLRERRRKIDEKINYSR